MNLPGYEILAELGRGGMGVVFKARHVALDRTVALKMILAGDAATPDDLARFRREARAFARLDHEHIVRIHDYGEADGRPYFVMEFVAGGTLRQRLAGNPLDPDAATRLVGRLAQAAHHAHANGVVHRDLKPANVLMTPDGSPKVADFGLARYLDETSDLTRTGALLGSPAYMAPEQVEGRPGDIGPATDVWALGAILYECLTGRPPFPGSNVFAILDRIRTAAPDPPHHVNPAVPVRLSDICGRCLEKRPADRYPSAEALADELAGVGTSNDTKPQALSAKIDDTIPQNRDRWWMV
jgi:serine/threonine protein kinase